MYAIRSYYAEVHSGSVCATCHDAATGAPVTPGAFADSVTSGANCEGCHTSGSSTWSTFHTASTSVSHDALVTADLNCTTSGCHDANGTGTARSTYASPYIGAGDVHETLSCGSCHNTDGTMRTGTLGDASGGAGDCSSCHGSDWTAIHTGASIDP